MSDDRDHGANGARRGGEPSDGPFDARIARSLAAHADVLVIDDRPFLVGAPERGSSSIPATRPIVRMSMTWRRPFRLCAASSQ